VTISLAVEEVAVDSAVTTVNAFTVDVDGGVLVDIVWSGEALGATSESTDDAGDDVGLMLGMLIVINWLLRLV
jgi:hypothetical protein